MFKEFQPESSTIGGCVERRPARGQKGIGHLCEKVFRKKNDQRLRAGRCREALQFGAVIGNEEAARSNAYFLISNHIGYFTFDTILDGKRSVVFAVSNYVLRVKQAVGFVRDYTRFTAIQCPGNSFAHKHQAV